jgi:hypothetical protein
MYLFKSIFFAALNISPNSPPIFPQFSPSGKFQNFHKRKKKRERMKIQRRENKRKRSKEKSGK